MTRALNLAAAAVVAIALATNVYRLWLLFATLFPGDDFRFYFAMARVGFQYGWSRMYDLDLQCRPISEIIKETTGHCPGLVLPPVAWLAAPFTALGYPAGYPVWVVFMALAFAAVLALSWDRLPRPKPLYLGAVLSVYPLAYCLFLGQVTMLATLGVALAWRLLARGHATWAGVGLVLILAKPHIAILVPLALLVTGRWRPVAVAGTITSMLGLISLISIGPHGVETYLSDLKTYVGEPDNYVYTLAGWFGENAYTTALQWALGLVTLYTAWRFRAWLDAVILVAIVGSALSATYWHVQDYAILILAVLVQLSLGPRRPAMTWLAAFFIVGSPLLVGTTFVPAFVQISSWIILLMAWLAWLATRPPTYFGASERTQAPVPAAAI
jgi:hypothetical protein